MAGKTENHTIRLLTEMRAELRDFRAEVNEKLEHSNLRMDGITHMMTLLAANVGGHEERIETLEEAVSQAAPE